MIFFCTQCEPTTLSSVLAFEFVRMNFHKQLQQSEVDTSAPLNYGGDIPLPFLGQWRGLIPPVSFHPCTTIAMKNMRRKSRKQPVIWDKEEKLSDWSLDHKRSGGQVAQRQWQLALAVQCLLVCVGVRRDGIVEGRALRKTTKLYLCKIKHPKIVLSCNVHSCNSYVNFLACLGYCTVYHAIIRFDVIMSHHHNFNTEV